MLIIDFRKTRVEFATLRLVVEERADTAQHLEGVFGLVTFAVQQAHHHGLVDLVARLPVGPVHQVHRVEVERQIEADLEVDEDTPGDPLGLRDLVHVIHTEPVVVVAGGLRRTTVFALPDGDATPLAVAVKQAPHEVIHVLQVVLGDELVGVERKHVDVARHACLERLLQEVRIELRHRPAHDDRVGDGRTNRVGGDAHQLRVFATTGFSRMPELRDVGLVPHLPVIHAPTEVRGHRTHVGEPGLAHFVTVVERRVADRRLVRRIGHVELVAESD